MDFNLNLESFEPHIAGVRNLIDLSIQSPKSPPILFTSSISTLDNWASKYPDDKVPESAFDDFSIPPAMGYGESKYVVEQLLEKAGKSSGVSAAICRVGQLAGPVVKGGIWNKQDWLPSVSSDLSIVSATSLRGAPEAIAKTFVSLAYSQLKVPRQNPNSSSFPRLGMIPVDITANVHNRSFPLPVRDAPSSTAAAWTGYHNLVNPQPGSWEALVPPIIKHFNDNTEPVGFESWFQALKATASETDDVARNPGIKLLEFFEQMEAGGVEAVLETERTVRRSPAMAELRAVGPEWMEVWLRQWDS